MQFKVFFSALVFGYATAAFLGGKAITVSDNGSQVRVASQTGVAVIIEKDIFSNGFLAGSATGQVDVLIQGPTAGVRRIPINDPRGARIVCSILAQNQGIVNELQFETILNRIENLVQTGEVDPRFVKVLSVLINDDLIQPTFGGILGRNIDQDISRAKIHNEIQLQDNVLVEDLLDKELKIEALRETQEKAQIAKTILKQDVTFGADPITRENAKAQIDALTETQINAEAIKDSLKQDLLQEHRQVTLNKADKQVVTGRSGVSQLVFNTLEQDEQNIIEREALVKDILKKQAKIQALRQIQEETEQVKDILKQEVAQEQQFGLQSGIGFGSQFGGNTQVVQQNILRKVAKIEALTHAQQKAEVTRQVLEQEIAQDEIKLTGQVSPKGLEALNRPRANLQKWSNGVLTAETLEEQVEIEKEALVDTLLRKQAKIEALTQIQAEIETEKQILKRENFQEETQIHNRWGMTNTWQVTGTGKVNEALLENILRKEAKLEALTEAQQKAEATKNLLKEQINQVQRQLQSLGVSVGDVEGFRQWNALGNLQTVGADFPFVSNQPSFWNQVSFGRQVPFTFGGRFTNFRGVGAYNGPWAREQFGNQFDRQIQWEREQQLARGLERQNLLL